MSTVLIHRLMRQLFPLPPEIISTVFVLLLSTCYIPKHYAYRVYGDIGGRTTTVPREYEDDDLSHYNDIVDQRKILALVCKQWHKILYQDPCCWADIVYSGQDIETSLLSWLQRTGSLPLNISMILPWGVHHIYDSGILWHSSPISEAKAYANKLLQIFIPLCHRIRIFQVATSCSVQMATVIDQLKPFLQGHLIESISLRHTHICDEFELCFKTKSQLPISAPLQPPLESTNLRHLGLACLPLSTVLLYPELATLTALDVCFNGIDIHKSWSIFSTFVGQARGLHHLRIIIRWLPTGGVHSHTPLQLAGLNSLTLILGDSYDTETLLRLFYIPNLRHLSLDCTSERLPQFDYSKAFTNFSRRNFSHVTALTVTWLVIDKHCGEGLLRDLQHLEVLTLHNVDNTHSRTAMLLGIILTSCLLPVKDQAIQDNMLCPKLKALLTYESDGSMEAELLTVRRHLGFNFTTTVNGKTSCNL